MSQKPPFRPQIEFSGGRKVPEVFKNNHVANSEKLIGALASKYPFLRKVIQRDPTTPLYPGKNKIDSLDYKIKLSGKFNYFMTWINTEIDHLSARLLITMYGLCEFGNVVRLEYDYRKPYFYTSFPFHLFDPSHQEYLHDHLDEFDLEELKNVIEDEIYSNMDDRQKNKYIKFCNKYNHPEGTLITDLRFEWHLEGVGNNMDTPKPFLKFTCLLPEIMVKVCQTLNQTRSNYHYEMIPKNEYEMIHASDPELCKTREIDKDDYKGIPKNKRDLVEVTRELNEFGQFEIKRVIYEKIVYTNYSWVHNLDLNPVNPKRFYLESPWNKWEADDAFIIKFLKDMGLKSCEWWEVSNVYKIQLNPHMFNVGMTMECSGVRIKPVSENDPIKRKFPDDVIFLFDGEMIGKAGHFPDAKKGNPIGQLGVHVIRTKALLNRYGLKEALEKELFYSILLTALPVQDFTSVFNDENNKYNVKVMRFVRKGHDRNNNNQLEEFQMLKTFCELMIYANPSFCFAYNGNRFDWPYIIDRMWMLHNQTDKWNRPKYDWNINDYIYVTRDFRSNRGIYHEKAREVSTEHLAKASARVSYDKVDITGIANMDLYLYVKQFAKYGMKSSYSLDAASMKYLKEKKIEINYDFIPILFQRESGRLSIAKYCNRDVELMTRLINVLGAMEFIYFIGQIAIIPPQQMVDRGTQYLVDGIWYTSGVVYNHLELYPEKNGIRDFFKQRHEDFKEKYFPDQQTSCMFLLPTGTFYIKDIEGPRSKGDDEKGGGADVIEAPTTLTEDTDTLDFASLYPSIMMTFNICPTTLIWFNIKANVLAQIKQFREQFNIPKSEALFKRKESWFCTGDSPKAYPSLQDAMTFLNSDQCNYPEKMKKLLKKIATKLFSSPENIERIAKYEPLALNQYDKIDPSIYTDYDKSDDGMEDAFINIVEPICQLTGQTKVQYKNNELPMFVGKGIRQGVFPWREQQLFDMRVVIKKEMNEASDEIERLLREGVNKSDERIKKLEAKKKECDVKQQAVKCAMNSMYGWLASKLKLKFSLQETVCVCGQFLLQDTKCFTDSLCKKSLDFIADYVTCSGDTDSIFSSGRNIDHSDVRKKFIVKIQKQYIKNDPHLFNIPAFEEMCNMVKNDINMNIADGKILDKYASKATLLLQWKHVFDDIYSCNNRYNALRLSSENQLSNEEIAMLRFLKTWLDSLFSKLDVQTSNMATASWKNIRFAPDPPLMTRLNSGQTVVTPQNVRMFIRWLHINMLFEHGKRKERVVNRIFKTKYNGVVKQELEKVYEHIIWWRKKKYAGCVWMPGASAPSIKATGIASVRGDCYPYKSKLCEETVNYLLEETDNEAAKRHGYMALRRIIEGKVSVHEFIQSKNIKKDLMEYGKRKQRTKVSFKGRNAKIDRVDVYNKDEIRIQEGMPVHVKNAIRRFIKHKEPLPQIDDRYNFIVMANYGSKSIPISERGIPPLAILKSGGIIQYDKMYYAEGCAKQISSLLEPIFDTRTFEQKMEQAERYRRTQNKEIRNERIEKFSKKQREIIQSHLMNYITQGVKMKDKDYMINLAPKLNDAKQTSIKTLFAAYERGERPQKRTRSGEDIDGVTIARSIEEIEKDKKTSFTIEDVMENLDGYASTIPYSFTQEEEEETETETTYSLDDMFIDLHENDSQTSHLLKKKNCDLCNTPTIIGRACKKCGAKNVNNDDQTYISHFHKKMDIKCIFCDKLNDKSICNDCKYNNGTEHLQALKHAIRKKQIENDCSKCARCFGVPAPQLPQQTNTPTCSSSSSSSSSSAHDEPPIVDIESIVDGFYNMNEPIKYCTAITCANRWVRVTNDRRNDVLKKVEYDLYNDDSELESSNNKKLRSD